LGEARLIGFFDLDRARAEEARDKYARMLEEYAAQHPQSAEAVSANLAELRCYDSLDALLAQVDVVDVATHTRGKMPAALAAIQKGVHVMVEKPMARTWTEARRVAQALADRPNVYFQLNDDNVFDPKYHLLHELIARAEIGTVQHASLIRGSRLDATSVLKAQANALENGGGCLMDYGSHGLAGIWYALGASFRPIKVEAVQLTVLHRHRILEGEPFLMEVDDNAQIKVLFEDQTTGAWMTVFLEATWTGGHIGLAKEKDGGQSGGFLRILGDKGVIEFDGPTCTIVRHWNGGEMVLPSREHPGESISFMDEVGTFLRCVRTGTPPAIDIDFGSEITAICGAAYLSAILERAVTLDEFKAFCQGYLEKLGDNSASDDALVLDLLKPYRTRA
jgi:predicted dehydrogenase